MSRNHQWDFIAYSSLWHGRWVGWGCQNTIFYFLFFSECTETSHCLSPKGLCDLGRGEVNGISKYGSLSKHRLPPKGLWDIWDKGKGGRWQNMRVCSLLWLCIQSNLCLAPGCPCHSVCMYTYVGLCNCERPQCSWLWFRCLLSALWRAAQVLMETDTVRGWRQAGPWLTLHRHTSWTICIQMGNDASSPFNAEGEVTNPNHKWRDFVVYFVLCEACFCFVPYKS